MDWIVSTPVNELRMLVAELDSDGPRTMVCGGLPGLLHSFKRADEMLLVFIEFLHGRLSRSDFINIFLSRSDL